MRGAESILSPIYFAGFIALKKERIAKNYRNEKLDLKLRLERTRSEARLLSRCKIGKIPTPVVLGVFDFSLILTKIIGKRPKLTPSICFEAGKILGKLHSLNIIHGDFTPANLIYGYDSNFKNKSKELFVIDFGLGFISGEIEPKAVDFLSMKNQIKHINEFEKGYKSSFIGFDAIFQKTQKIESRVRYSQ